MRAWGGAAILALLFVPSFLFNDPLNSLGFVVLMAAVALNLALIVREKWLPAGILLTLLGLFHLWGLTQPLMSSR